MSKPKWCRAPGPIELSTLINGGQLERERENDREREKIKMVVCVKIELYICKLINYV